MADITSNLFGVATIFSLCSLVCYYMFHPRENALMFKYNGFQYEFIFILNCGYFLTIYFNAFPLFFSKRLPFVILLVELVIYLKCNGFPERLTLACFPIVVILFGYMLFFQLVPVQNLTGFIIIALYFFAIPFIMLCFTEKKSRAAWNILTYLSLLLPTVHFLCVWIWYDRTVDLHQGTIFLTDVIWTRISCIFAVLHFYTMFAKNTIGSNIFRIEISGNRIMKEWTLFCLWFLITATISFIIGYMLISFGEPSVLDRHAWFVTKNGLTPREQIIVDEIKAIEIDMSKCGQYQNAKDNLSQIIDNYKSENEENQGNLLLCYLLNFIIEPNNFCYQYQINAVRFNNTFKTLYPLRGLLFYHRGKYREALDDFHQSLNYDPNNIKIQFYTVFAHNMLGEYSEADLYLHKSIEKYKTDSENIENQWILATLIDYQSIIRQNYGKHTKQKDEERKKVNISPSLLIIDNWPTHLEFAELSSIAYCKDRLSSFPLWSFIDEYDDTNESGYYGIAIQHKETKEIVIAHRGTVFDINNASLLADYALFILVIPQQFQVAQQFMDKIRRQMNPKSILWHTGHSLGGAIAEFLVANETLFKQEHLSFAVAFDSPGMMEFLKEFHHHSKIEQNLLKSDEFPVISYLSAPNIVNTMGTHIGLSLRLSPIPLLSAPYYPFIKTIYNLLLPSQFTKFMDIFLKQANLQLHWHNLQSIIDCFKFLPNINGFPIITKPVIQWPVGSQQFIRFLDLASRHNLTTLDLSKHWDKTHEVLYAFKRCNYHVIDNSEGLLISLPLELWSSEKQSFLKEFVHNDFQKKNVTIQLKPNCQLFKSAGVDTVQMILDILYWKTDHLYPDMKMIALNESAIPIYNERLYKINILSIYTLFSLIKLDNCL